MSNLIQAEQLAFRYSGEAVFSNVSFSIQKGDFVSVIGSNGAGKSTLLKLMLGELPLQKGEIRLFGEPLSRFRQWPRVGYLPQNSASGSSDFPATVMEVVQSNLYAQVGLFRFLKKSHRESCREALRLVGMEDFSGQMIGTLSGGQRQRVLLARVLVGNPDIMFLDEPTNGVDGQAVLSLYRLLRQLNCERGLTIVMVTHDIARARPFITRTLCLEEGTMVELDEEQLEAELAHKHKHPNPSACQSSCQREEG